MENKFKNIIIYGLVFDEFEAYDFATDFLSGVRANFFNSNMSPQQNKTLQHINGDTYFYNFSFEKDKAPFWLLKKNNQVLQQTLPLDDGYVVECFRKESVYKKLYFDISHNWVKTDYFVDEKLVYSISKAEMEFDFALELNSFEENKTSVLFPRLDIESDNIYHILAYTNVGFVYFANVPNKDNIENSYGFTFTAEDFAKENPEGFSIMNAEYLTDATDPEVINAEKTATEILDDTLEEKLVEEKEEVVVEVFDETPDAEISSGNDIYKYFGETKQGKREGYGRTVTPEGKTAYEGEYKSDKRNGFGSFYCKNGDINYVGNWKDNNRNGFGIGFRTTDFTSHTGKWENNIPQGIGARFDKEGNFIFLGEFVDGKKQGFGITFDNEAGFVVSKFEDDEVISSQILEDIFPNE